MLGMEKERLRTFGSSSRELRCQRFQRGGTPQMQIIGQMGGLYSDCLSVKAAQRRVRNR